MIIGYRNYRSYDEVMIKLAYDEFVTIYDHHNIFFENMVFDAFLACLFNVHYLIFLSMVMNMHILLWIYLEKGPLQECGVSEQIRSEHFLNISDHFMQ